MIESKYGKRLSWDETFIKIAETLANRTSCINHKTGCVFVDGMHRIVSVGYNGSVRGDVNCLDVGCAKIHGDPATGQLERCRGAHGEVNGIVNCIQPERLRGSTLYITTFPCWDCMKQVINIGVKEIIFTEIYRRVASAGKTEFETEAWKLALKTGVSIYQYDKEKDARIPIKNVPN